jgi:hypothetical protein
MGIGRYKNGKFDLILSIRHQADSTRILQWERSFKRASEILFDATDGQMQFGKLFVANNSVGSSEADAWLMDEEGDSVAYIDALGTAGLHMTLKSDEKNKPFVVIHEFGHYGFGLYDEYIGPDGDAECTGSTAQGACIMEHGWWDGDQIDDVGNLTPGPVNEFCVDDNHDPDQDTYQEDIHGESCWQTIKDNYPDIDVPGGLPDAPAPTGHDAVDWIIMAEDPRFVLVLDKSGSMSINNAISGVRYGADYWLQYLAQTGDSLSVVAYSQTPAVILPLTTLTAAMNLSAIQTSISNILASGSTNIGGAMQEGLNQITSPGDIAATQVMILFSDGLHNTGALPENVLDEVIENGIRVYTIGFGPYADQARLQQIAQNSGGRFEQIDADPDMPDAQLAIQNYLIEISGEVRDGSGIVTMKPGLLPELTASELSEATQYLVAKDAEKLPFAFRCRYSGFDHKAYIEKGSTRATFVLSYQDGTSVNFFLTKPDGKVVNPTSDSDAKFVNPPNVPYAFYVVDNPKPGYWVMRITRAQAMGEIPFKVFAFSENKNINAGIKGIRNVYDVFDKVKLQTQVYHKVPLTDIQNPVVRTLPKVSMKTHSVVGRPELEIEKKVTLKQRNVRYDAQGKLLDKEVPLKNGVFEGELSFDHPGSYSVSLRFVNTGKAVEALPEAERTRKEDKVEKAKPAPKFMRTKRFQIHVGPLPKGKDVESDKKDDFLDVDRDIPKQSYDVTGNFKLNVAPIKK